MNPRKKSEQKIDPTLPFTEIEIGGQTYKMCFDNATLFEAEEYLHRRGHDVNLLRVFPVLNGSNARIFFAMSLHRFHPGIGFDEARNMVTLGNLHFVANAVAQCILASYEVAGGKKQADPPEPSKESDD
jgi:hypothetical protein